MRSRVARHLQHEQLAALEALAHGVDARDGGTLQPHGHQRLAQLLVAVVLEGDARVRAARRRGAAQREHRGQHQHGGGRRVHCSSSSSSSCLVICARAAASTINISERVRDALPHLSRARASVRKVREDHFRVDFQNKVVVNQLQGSATFTVKRAISVLH